MTTTYTTEQRKELFLLMLQGKAGNITRACEAVGVSRRTYYDWIDRDEDFAAACEDVQEGLIDFAESKLQENIADNSNQAIIFFLKTKGKSRGYVERQEISGPDGKPLELVNTITINLAVLSTKELEQLQKIARKIRDAAGDEDGAGKPPGPGNLIPFDGTAKSAIRAGQS
jgi:hypothetical protein